jgi:hypothetical protein
MVETDNNENWLWATVSKMPLESSPLTVRIYVSKHRMDGICGYDGKSWQKYRVVTIVARVKLSDDNQYFVLRKKILG